MEKKDKKIKIQYDKNLKMFTVTIGYVYYNFYINLIDKEYFNVTIMDSHLIVNKNEQIAILTKMMKMWPKMSARTLKSYLREWRAHNRLYKFHLFKKHTKDVDLNTNESKFRRLGYFFLGF